MPIFTTNQSEGFSVSMSLYITSLNSGSNGNCYYIGTEEDAIFVDAGLSCREIEKRMLRLGLSMARLRAIFITHEHADHIFGVAAIAKKYQLPVYITADTMRQGKLSLDPHLVSPFTAFTPVSIGSMNITAFPKFHDACDPHSFIVSSQTVTVGVFTDIGSPCTHVIHHFQQCNAAFLEANYDDDLLTNGRYPVYLKNRIRGNRGHLSNRQAHELFTNYRPAFMSHLFLSHLSKDNNCPELVQQLFASRNHPAEIVIASRFHETGVYRIHQEVRQHVYYPHPYAQVRPARPVQLTLF